MADAPTSFVNVLEVDPERQQELVDLLTEGADVVIRHRPGFVSSTILASLDGTRVVNHAQWASPADARATQADPAAAVYARRIAAIATATSPAVYRVAVDIR